MPILPLLDGREYCVDSDFPCPVQLLVQEEELRRELPPIRWELLEPLGPTECIDERPGRWEGLLDDAVEKEDRLWLRSEDDALPFLAQGWERRSRDGDARRTGARQPVGLGPWLLVVLGT